MLRQWLQRTDEGDADPAALFGGDEDEGEDEEDEGEEGASASPLARPRPAGATPLAPPAADAASWTAGDARPAVLVPGVRPGDVLSISVLTSDARVKAPGAYSLAARWGGWKGAAGGTEDGGGDGGGASAGGGRNATTTASTPRPVCQADCGSASGHGTCVSDGVCACAPGRGGAACQGPAVALAPGQAAEGDVPPGEWAFFDLLPPATDAAAPAKDRRLLVLAYDTRGGHPLILARRATAAATGGSGGSAPLASDWPSPATADAVLRAGAFASGPDAVAFDPADAADPGAPMRVALYNTPLTAGGGGEGGGGAPSSSYLTFRLRLGLGPPADAALRAGARRRGAITAWLAAALALSGLVALCGVGLAVRGVAVVLAARRARRAQQQQGGGGGGGGGGPGGWFGGAAPPGPPPAPAGLSPAAIAALPLRIYSGDGGGGGSRPASAKPTATGGGGLSLTAAPAGATPAPKADPAAAPSPPLPPPLHHAPSADWRPQCAVCVCEFEAGDALARLPVCGHEYHAPCIAGWLARAATCPVCRAGVEGERGGGEGAVEGGAVVGVGVGVGVEEGGGAGAAAV